MCIQNTIRSLKCDFFDNIHPPKGILFRSFTGLLRTFAMAPKMVEKVVHEYLGSASYIVPEVRSVREKERERERERQTDRRK